MSEAKKIIDPFADLNSLRIVTPVEAIKVVKEPISIRVDKPDKRRFFQVRNDPAFELECMIIEASKDSGKYLVLPSCAAELESEATRVKLVTCITRDAEMFLWPLVLPGVDGRTNRWHESAFEAAEIGRHGWIRLLRNMNAGCYEVLRPAVELENPVYPNKSFEDILRLAFKDRVIDSIDHPVIQGLRGIV